MRGPDCCPRDLSHQVQRTPVGSTCLSLRPDGPPRGSGAAAPHGALRAIDSSACPRSWRTCGPRRLRRQSEPDLVATQGGCHDQGLQIPTNSTRGRIGRPRVVPHSRSELAGNIRLRLLVPFDRVRPNRRVGHGVSHFGGRLRWETAPGGWLWGSRSRTRCLRFCPFMPTGWCPPTARPMSSGLRQRTAPNNDPNHSCLMLGAAPLPTPELPEPALRPLTYTEPAPKPA